MKASLIPKSKAKTAFGLLSDIAAVALGEPKRIRMSIFLNVNAKAAYGDEAPACNTVGCICGWAVALKGTKDQIEQQARSFVVGFTNYGDMVGASMLGLGSAQAAELFNPDDGIKGNAGTMTHARSVVARIRRFQKKYRTQLLAKKV